MTAFFKQPKAKPNPKYLEAVRLLPCIICQSFGEVQNSPTEAHHCKSGRFSNEKMPDEMAIPLCHSHHNKLRPYPGDESKIGYHNGQETWETKYGPDTDYIPVTQDVLGYLLGANK